MVYLDYNATTPIDEEVLESYIKTSKNFFANTSSLHKLGKESNYMYELAINEIKKTLNVEHNIVFTSNATEANNLGIFGIVNNHKSGKIITTKTEHASVFEPIKALKDQFEIIYLDILENGMIDLEQLKREINKDTILVSIMWVNNVLGTVNNINEIIKIVKPYSKAKLHVDAVQGLCKVVPNFDFNDIDLFTFSTHKIYGPKGIGGLIYKKGLNIQKQLYGSSAQFGLKPGTFDLSLIVATTKAFKKFFPKTKENQLKVKEIFDYAYAKLSKLNGVIINTPFENISYYCLNFSVINFEGETVVRHLENDDIYVSTSSACSSKLKTPEKTILALTNDNKRALSSVRISFSYKVCKNDIDRFVESLERLLYV